MTVMGTILTAIENGASTPDEIAVATGMRPVSVPPRLTDLHRLGVVTRERVATGKTGRPSFRYAIKGESA